MKPKISMDCKLCTDYRACRKGGKDVCPWAKERIEADEISFRKAVQEALNIGKNLDPRLEKLVSSFTWMWKDEAHSLRMKTAREMTSTSAEIDDPPYNAVLYFLSSSCSLFSRVIDCFQHDGLHFDRARLCHICHRDYAIYLAALNIYHGERQALAERAIKHAMNDADLALIVNALIIARLGPAAFEIKR